MGFAEAKKDGIRHEKRGYTTFYFPACCICGGEVETINYKSSLKYTCQECKAKKLLADKEKKQSDDYDTKEKKFDNAVERIRKIVGNICDYTYAIEKIHSKLHIHGWFDSTEEIMVAIELVKNKIKARHQVKFGRYRADFVLPDEKIVLEVDGHIYHTESTREKETVRDDLIILALGADWEVIRISDTLINQNITKLISAIRKVRDKRRKLREKNNGTLPEWYSDRIN